MEPNKRQQIDYLYELMLTFSNKKSLFSSKRLERFTIFTIFLSLTIIYVGFNIRILEPRDFVEITLVWLGYGGYNTFMTLRDKKVEKGLDGSDFKEETN